jgi:hypothetical protein
VHAKTAVPRFWELLKNLSKKKVEEKKLRRWRVFLVSDYSLFLPENYCRKTSSETLTLSKSGLSQNERAVYLNEITKVNEKNRIALLTKKIFQETPRQFAVKSQFRICS